MDVDNASSSNAITTTNAEKMDGGSADKGAGNGEPGIVPLPKFVDNEKVLCFHGVLLYEAKVLMTEYREKDKEHAYWIHYLGWNKSWDEWIYEKRVLKFCDENLEKQKELKLAHAATKALAKGKSGTKPGPKKKSLASDVSSVQTPPPTPGPTTDLNSSTPGVAAVVPALKLAKEKASGKDAQPQQPSAESDEKSRKKLTACVEPESHYKAKQEVNIPMPECLKFFLVDDWDFVTQQKTLVKLPARITVVDILDEYLKEKEGTDQNAIELCDGLKIYFDTMLGSRLLFRPERKQYEELMKEMAAKDENERKKPSEIYGSSHLLRMFTNLGGLLAFTNLDEEATKLLVKEVEDLLEFLLRNFDKYFSVEDYSVCIP